MLDTPDDSERAAHEVAKDVHLQLASDCPAGIVGRDVQVVRAPDRSHPMRAPNNSRCPDIRRVILTDSAVRMA